MKRWMLAGLLLLWIASAAMAHFVFVVPEREGLIARVFLSETLTPDPAIDAAYVKNGSLWARDAAGHETALRLADGKGAMEVKVAAGTRLVHGEADLGVTDREADHPYWLIYYPKTIFGDAFDGATDLSAAASRPPVELLPQGKIGAVTLKLLINGKPTAGAQITVLLPDGQSKKVTTGPDGLTEAFAQQGRYGAWARDWEKTSGEHGRKPYQEIRRYATVVFDAGTSAAPAANQPVTGPAITATPFATLPETAASFGVIADGGWLYVYGGHIAPTHSYSTAAVSGQFHRLKLSDGKTWESLPGGPAMQGMNLAAYAGKIYRVGGMIPRNKPGEAEDIWSTDVCAVFDPATRAWEALPDLPAPRSSHDVVVAGDTLFVVGGWTLRGSEQTLFAETMLTMDLKAAKPEWKSVPQPFKRRALIAAVLDGKVCAIGGFNEDSEMVNEVAIFDPAAGQWKKGPDLPGEENGFGPAACTLDGKLYVSVADGTLYRLSAAGDRWEAVGRGTPRIVHRLAADGSNILVIGGAADGRNFDLIEAIAVKK